MQSTCFSQQWLMCVWSLSGGRRPEWDGWTVCDSANFNEKLIDRQSCVRILNPSEAELPADWWTVSLRLYFPACPSRLFPLYSSFCPYETPCAGVTVAICSALRHFCVQERCPAEPADRAELPDYTIQTFHQPVLIGNDLGTDQLNVNFSSGKKKKTINALIQRLFSWFEDYTWLW